MKSNASLCALAEVVCGAFERSKTGVVVVDERLSVLGLSRAVTGGLPRGAAPRRLDRPQGNPLALAASRCLSTATTEHVELDVLPWSPDPGAWCAQISPLESGGERGLLIQLSEAGELHALRNRLARASKLESLGRLAGSIAHDFNNLLTGIRGSVALARYNSSPQSHDAALTAADLASQRAGEMIRQMLSFQQQPRAMAPQADATAVVAEAVGLVRCMPAAPQISLEVEPALGVAEISAASLHQIVLNLLVNAQEAIRSAQNITGAVAGSIHVSTSSFHRTPDKHHELPLRRWLRLTVTDSGPGMDAATRNRIFDPFFSTKPSGVERGLGLATVRQLVEQAGGWVEVEGELAQGATFAVYLPLASDGVDMTGDGLATVAHGERADKVLICDDESRLATLTAGLLEEFGFQPVTVALGDEALAVLREQPARADVLLLDVNLSVGLPAQDVLEAMQREGILLPVILTSGFALEDVPPALREHERVACYLAKPYTVDELVAAITGAVGDRPAAAAGAWGSGSS